MPDRPLLVGIHGVKRSGKDTAATCLEEWASGRSFSFKRRGFADKVKHAFARQFYPTITMEEAIIWVDRYKASPVKIVVEDPSDPSRHLAEVDFRQAVAQFATEGARLVYGEDHWVDLLLPVKVYMDAHDLPLYPKWHDSFIVNPYEGDGNVHLQGQRVVADICAIIDLRFDNEVERIRRLGGTLVKIRRKSAEDAVLAQPSIHESELGIPDQEFDYVVSNNKTIDDLRIMIFSLAETLMQERV